MRIYEVNNQGQSQGKAAYAHDAPVLGVCWNKDGSKLFSGGVDKAAKMFDLTTGTSQQVGVHDAPIKAVRWVEAPTGGILATGSWDKTVKVCGLSPTFVACTSAKRCIKYWDLRTPNPVASISMADKVYSMDIQYPLMVVGTAERHIQIVNLNSPTTIFKVYSFLFDTHHKLTDFVVEHVLSTQVANSGCRLFPQRLWFRSGERRGPRCDPVSPSNAGILMRYLNFFDVDMSKIRTRAQTFRSNATGRTKMGQKTSRPSIR